jgi:glycosyltransferase involved in cell wall biosynthesis
MSFNSISEQHIKHLSAKIKIQKIDEEVLDNLMWIKPRNILLHPVLYTTIGDKAGMFQARHKRLENAIKIKSRLGGFETADSDQISKVAVDVLNRFDVVFLPSTFAINALRKSGVSSPLELVPHGLSDALLDPDRTIAADSIRHIQQIKQKNEATLVLFFCLHSDYRKGADLVYEAMEHIQGMHSDVYLVVKKTSHDTEIKKKMRSLRLIEIPTWLSESELRQLYDVCDMLLVPSRGGGFELNALEGLARGIPTLAPNAGCFTDYIQYAIPLPVVGNPKVFPDNPIHVGNGWETSVDQLAHMIHQVLGSMETWKEKADANAPIIRQKYSWTTVCNSLFDLLVKHGFCGKS